MNALILGSGSEIAKGLAFHLTEDGWSVDGWQRGEVLPKTRFDLCIVAIGRVAPVGLWHEVDKYEWHEGIEDNLLTPFRLLHYIWPQHNSRAAVCFLAGSNPQMIMEGYSAYNVGKMALLKMVEQLDHETPDARFFALGPGTILTKIHEPTRKAKWKNEKLAAAEAKALNVEQQIRRVYETLMWCCKQPKEVIGGRNLCASDPWDTGGFLAETLKRNPSMYKLRRMEP